MTRDKLTDAWAPATCTLPTAELPLRLAEFDDLLAPALRRVDRPDRTRLVLTLDEAPGRAEALRDLTRRETECCSFFAFTVTEHDKALVLEVAVPAAHVDTLDAIAERATLLSGLGR